MLAVVVEEVFEIGEEAHESSSSVSTTDQPSFLKSGYRCRRSTWRRSALANMSWGVRRSPSRRSRTIRTSRQSSKCRRSSSYRFRRPRATTKRSNAYVPVGRAVTARKRASHRDMGGNLKPVGRESQWLHLDTEDGEGLTALLLASISCFSTSTRTCHRPLLSGFTAPNLLASLLMRWYSELRLT